MPASNSAPPAALSEAHGKLKWGFGLGVFAALSYALLGTVCPLCLIASPALIGAGLFGRAKARRGRQLVNQLESATNDHAPR